MRQLLRKLIDFLLPNLYKEDFLIIQNNYLTKAQSLQRKINMLKTQNKKFKIENQRLNERNQQLEFNNANLSSGLDLWKIDNAHLLHLYQSVLMASIKLRNDIDKHIHANSNQDNVNELTKLIYIFDKTLHDSKVTRRIQIGEQRSEDKNERDGERQQ